MEQASSLLMGPVSGFCQPRPSGPPPASQRRAISVVEGQNEENCDHADHASGGLMANLERCSQHFRRGLPGMVIVRNGTRLREVLPAQCHARHASVSGVFRVLLRFRIRSRSAVSTGLLGRCDALASQRPSVAPSAWSRVG